LPSSNILTASMYGIAEVSRLAQLPKSNVQRWLRGYVYVGRDRVRRRQGPVVQRTNEPYASFLDLIELRFAKGFIDAGLSTQKVREAFNEAAEITGQDHAFARKKFFSVGKRLFLELERKLEGREEKERQLLELFTNGQWVIEPVVRQYATQVKFDEETKAVTRWWPLGRDVPIIIDPAFGYGAPTLEDKGIKTANIYALYRGEGRKASSVARWMDISVDEVEAAVMFEREWQPRLAA
jgi:hypothetical protein